MIKFKSVSDDELSSSDESNAGLVRWNRKPSTDNKDASSINSFSLSHESLSDDDSSSSESSKSFISSRSQSFSGSSRSLSPKLTTRNSLEEKNKCQDQNKSNYLNRQSSDDSVIFADVTTNDEDEKQPVLKKNKSCPNVKTNNTENKAKTMKKNRAKSQENNNKENHKKLVNEFKRQSKLQRQFIYIQMEYCGGKTLKDLIEKGLYKNQEKVWFLLREILQGLNHIHEQGMIHRDLKPGNVLIDALGHAKIGDFGLATSKLIMQNDIKKFQDTTSILAGNGANLSGNNVESEQCEDVRQVDSVSMSGAVGTALYVAPELITPSNKNRFIYTQVN